MPATRKSKPAGQANAKCLSTFLRLVHHPHTPIPHPPTSQKPSPTILKVKQISVPHEARGMRLSVKLWANPLWRIVLFFYAFLISFSDIRHSIPFRLYAGSSNFDKHFTASSSGVPALLFFRIFFFSFSHFFQSIFF